MYICRPLVYLEFIRTDILEVYSIIEILGKNKVSIIKNLSFLFLKHSWDKFLKTFYNEEFDPGSGWTLAAGLTHASRGVTGVLALADDRRTGA